MQETEAKWAQILSKDEEYKKLSGMSALAQMRLARAKTPEAMEKLAKEIDSYNIRKLEIQERIIGNRGVEPSAAYKSAPKVGTVQDGYKFKGGEPSNPSSWEKV